MEESIQAILGHIDPKLFTTVVAATLSICAAFMLRGIVAKIKNIKLDEVGIIRPILLFLVLLSSTISLLVHLKQTCPDDFPLIYVPIVVLGFATSALMAACSIGIMVTYDQRGNERGWW
tara:strand:- start:21409 stop:21765 length:357 start_codon:yes stop_codon:yes gene_type:complete